MKYLIISVISILSTPTVFAQTPVSQIEGYLEVYHPQDSTSIYLGKQVARNVYASHRNNTVLGFAAGRDLTTGIRNSFVGFSAGKNNTEGNSNSFFLDLMQGYLTSKVMEIHFLVSKPVGECYLALAMHFSEPMLEQVIAVLTMYS